jgi:hypothetical protein
MQDVRCSLVASTCTHTRTCLAVGKDGHVVARQRCVQQLVDAAEVHDLCLADVGPQARVERKLALHRGTRGARHHHLHSAQHGMLSTCPLQLRGAGQRWLPSAQTSVKRSTHTFIELQSSATLMTFVAPLPCSLGNSGRILTTTLMLSSSEPCGCCCTNCSDCAWHVATAGGRHPPRAAADGRIERAGACVLAVRVHVARA